MADPEHDEILRLREENTRLKRKVTEEAKIGDGSDRRNGNTADELRAANLELREKLLSYRSLEEELAVQRVFEKSKRKVLQWLTFGGSVVTIASAVGWVLSAPGLKEYAKNRVDDQIQKVTSGRVNEIVAERIRLAVDPQLADLSGTVNATIRLASLPDAKKSFIDYSGNMGPAGDEGSEGSTTAFAVAAAMEYQLRRNLGVSVRLSPRWLYYLARGGKEGASAGPDTGAVLENALSAARDVGAIPEDAWPYKAGEYAALPPKSVDPAPHYKIKASKRLSGLREIKAALENSGPIVAGIALYESGWEQFERTARLPVPHPKERARGGHAICIVGFDDKQRLLKFQNMWGPSWGDHGYGYLPYEYVDDANSEFWAIAL
jgi:C1A family cysteine protease